MPFSIFLVLYFPHLQEQSLVYFLSDFFFSTPGTTNSHLCLYSHTKLVYWKLWRSGVEWSKRGGTTDCLHLESQSCGLDLFCRPVLWCASRIPAWWTGRLEYYTRLTWMSGILAKLFILKGCYSFCLIYIFQLHIVQDVFLWNTVRSSRVSQMAVTWRYQRPVPEATQTHTTPMYKLSRSRNLLGMVTKRSSVFTVRIREVLVLSL